MMNASAPPLKALHDFREARDWVASNSRRFVNDVPAVAALWKTETPVD
jgi:hypothetical protein